MFEELKKYLNDYSKEIDEQPQQEYEKSLRDLWEKNAELALNALADLNVRYPDLSSRRIKIYYDDIVASDKKTFEALEKQIHLIYDYTELAAKYEQSVIDRPVSEMVADQVFLLDVLKSILSEDYRPPDKTEDAINHLSTLYLLYSQVMPTTSGLSNAVPLRAGYALALLNGNALIKSFVADDKGFDRDRTIGEWLPSQERKKMTWKICKEKHAANPLWGELSVSRMADFIIEAFKEKGEGTPGHSTIRKYIREGRERGKI